jgi:hypothetical protein
MLEGNGTKIDAYTRSHLVEAEQRIARAIEAIYLYHTDDIQMNTNTIFMLGQDGSVSPMQR